MQLTSEVTLAFLFLLHMYFISLCISYVEIPCRCLPRIVGVDFMWFSYLKSYTCMAVFTTQVYVLLWELQTAFFFPIFGFAPVALRLFLTLNVFYALAGVLLQVCCCSVQCAVAVGSVLSQFAVAVCRCNVPLQCAVAACSVLLQCAVAVCCCSVQCAVAVFCCSVPLQCAVAVCSVLL